MADDIDELDDTAPLVPLAPLPPLGDEEFAEAPTRPGVRLDAAAPIGADLSRDELNAVRHQHWDRALRAVADAVRRVFADDSP